MNLTVLSVMGEHGLEGRSLSRPAPVPPRSMRRGHARSPADGRERE
ncbi:hypothetical protein [Streptomyces sp. WG7]